MEDLEPRGLEDVETSGRHDLQTARVSRPIRVYYAVLKVTYLLIVGGFFDNGLSN